MLPTSDFCFKELMQNSKVRKGIISALLGISPEEIVGTKLLPTSTTEEYLDGKSFLNPMTMTDVAEHIGIHTSTVSRAIKGKYIQYPGGTTVVKNLFSASVTMTDGDVAVGPMQIKEMIKELINGEDKHKPYSDQAIVKILNERNIDISRRAVAKYREELGIKGSFDRRELR